MANLQYIGARYVPKFYDNPDTGDNEWKSGVPYEPLTVVTYGGNSYTSKIPVAGTVGDPASNPTFWVKTGDYNASMTALQNEVNDIKSDLGSKTILTENSTLNDALYAVHLAAANIGKMNHLNYFRAVRASYFDSLIGTSDSTFRGMQGATYNPDRNELCFVVIKNDDSAGYIVTVDADDPTTIVNRKLFSAAELGHGNQIAYDSKRACYVMIAYNITVLTINPVSLDIMTSTTLNISGIDNLIHGMAYDADNDLYYGQTYAGVQIIDPSTMAIIDYKSWSNNLLSLIKAGAAYSASNAVNGFMYHDGLFYNVVMRHSNNSMSQKIVIFDADLNALTNYDVSDIARRFECESLFVMNGVKYFMGVSTMFGIYAFYTSPESTPYTLENYLNDGVGVANGDTLGEVCYDTGKYSIESAINATLTDSPFAGDIILYSLPVSDRQCQIAIGGHISLPSIAYRLYDATNSTWRAWNYIYNVAQINNGMSLALNEIFTGYVDNSGNVVFDIPMVTFPSGSIAGNFALTVYGYGYVNGSEITIGSSGTPITCTKSRYTRNIRVTIPMPTPIADHYYPIALKLNVSIA